MKKFLCYDTNDAASGKVNVDSRGMLKPNSTVPSGGTPYQQLVTDGDGNTRWEDRLAYETGPVLTEFVSEETVTFTPNSGKMAALWPPTFNAIEGSTYTVKFDGNEYKCSCIRLGRENGPLVLGNLSILGAGDDTGEPFVMVYNNQWQTGSSDSTSEHTISISGKQVSISKIDEKFLPVASDETYGVVKKSELVTPYVFDSTLNGIASLGEIVVSLSGDTIFVLTPRFTLFGFVRLNVLFCILNGLFEYICMLFL